MIRTFTTLPPRHDHWRRQRKAITRFPMTGGDGKRMVVISPWISCWFHRWKNNHQQVQGYPLSDVIDGNWADRYFFLLDPFRWTKCFQMGLFSQHIYTGKMMLVSHHYSCCSASSGICTTSFTAGPGAFMARLRPMPPACWNASNWRVTGQDAQMGQIGPPMSSMNQCYCNLL